MDINNQSDVHHDIKNKFYKAKLNKIMKLASSGDYAKAFKAIIRLSDTGDINWLTQRDMWDGVNELAAMEGRLCELNPFKKGPLKENTAQKPKKKKATKAKKRKSRKLGGRFGVFIR